MSWVPLRPMVFMVPMPNMTALRPVFMLFTPLFMVWMPGRKRVVLAAAARDDIRDWVITGRVAARVRVVVAWGAGLRVRDASIRGNGGAGVFYGGC